MMDNKTLNFLSRYGSSLIVPAISLKVSMTHTIDNPIIIGSFLGIFSWILAHFFVNKIVPDVYMVLILLLVLHDVYSS